MAFKIQYQRFKFWELLSNNSQNREYNMQALRAVEVEHNQEQEELSYSVILVFFQEEKLMRRVPLTEDFDADLKSKQSVALELSNFLGLPATTEPITSNPSSKI